MAVAQCTWDPGSGTYKQLEEPVGFDLAGILTPDPDVCQAGRTYDIDFSGAEPR